jgi:hypothetical protein
MSCFCVTWPKDASTDPSIRRFGDFTVELTAGELLRESSRIDLQNRAFQVLAILLRSPSEMVSRQELHRALWGDDVVVEFDNNLNAAVNRLRRALGDSADGPRFVETLPGQPAPATNLAPRCGGVNSRVHLEDFLPRHRSLIFTRCGNKGAVSSDPCRRIWSQHGAGAAKLRI